VNVEQKKTSPSDCQTPDGFQEGTHNATAKKSVQGKDGKKETGEGVHGKTVYWGGVGMWGLLVGWLYFSLYYEDAKRRGAKKKGEGGVSSRGGGARR